MRSYLVQEVVGVALLLVYVVWVALVTAVGLVDIVISIFSQVSRR
jgi:hypothetical protein